jgi:hypothetical protein
MLGLFYFKNPNRNLDKRVFVSIRLTPRVKSLEVFAAEKKG